MNFISLIIPALLVLYILFKSSKNLVAICVLPLLIFLGRSTFIDTYGWGIIIGPLPITITDVIFGGLILVWLYIRYRRPQNAPIRLTVEIVVMLIFGVFILVETMLTWLDGYRLVRIIQLTRYYLYLPAGFFIFLDIFRRVTEDEANNLIATLSAVCLPLSVIYSVSALGFRIYPYPAYLTVYVGQETLVRDFLTFPIFAPMAFAFYLAQSKRDWRWGIALIIITLCLALTFTRSIVVGASACMGVAILNEFAGLARRATLIRGLSGSVLIVAVGLSGFGLLQWISPEAFNYLSERIEELQVGGIGGSSLAFRFDMVQGIGEILTHSNPIFGVGLVPFDEADPTGMLYRSQWILGDILWAWVLLYLGLAGVVIYGLLLLIALGQSFQQSWNSADQSLRLGLFLFLWFVQMIAVTFTSNDFIVASSVAALPFALLTVARQRAWAVNPVTIPLNQFFSGIHFRWFTQNDEYRWLRLGTLALVMIVIEIVIIRRLVR
jgi:hypothetical protein